MIGTSTVYAAAKPNIVFILVDDLGYSDLHFSGFKKVVTPAIDQLSKESMYFNNAYAAAPVSSPTRASILTGKSPAELKLTCHIPGMGMTKYLHKMNASHKEPEAFFTDHISPNEQTLGTLTKQAGYNTAFLGKWHLGGSGSIYTSNGIVNSLWDPEHYGFDLNLGGCAYGQPKSYFSPYKNGTLPDGKEREFLTDRLGNEAINYIKKNNPAETGKPFFLYLSYYAVHRPYQVPIDAVKNNKGNKYFALIQKMDESIGRVLNALRVNDLIDNTIVVFYSDNGGVYPNPPLSGTKGSLLEGGIRVPLLVRWPNKIKANTTCNIPVTSIDFFPTIRELIDSKSANPKLSGRSIVPLLLGHQDEWSTRPLFWHFPHNRDDATFSMGSAIREGDWKLIYTYDNKKVHLFNLKDDIKESVDQSKKYPSKVSQMLSELQQWQKSVHAEFPAK